MKAYHNRDGIHPLSETRYSESPRGVKDMVSIMVSSNESELDTNIDILPETDERSSYPNFRVFSRL
jgi:hypothetical protein